MVHLEGCDRFIMGWQRRFNSENSRTKSIRVIGRGNIWQRHLTLIGYRARLPSRVTTGHTDSM